MRRSPQLGFAFRTWGGRRRGAGRKRSSGRRSVPHRPRHAHDPRCPLHVTLRAHAGLPSLRENRLHVALREALGAASSTTFRILHYSVQRDHVHLIVEADAATGLRRGMQGFAIRAAKAVNRALGRRGRVWGDRFHARMLARPREVRNALIYVLQNWRKHLRNVRGLDPWSSAAWFTGWRQPCAVPPGRPPVARARTWLAGVGWRRFGLVGPDEVPTDARRCRARPSTDSRR